MTLYYDKLIDRYIPTDSGWNFHPDNTALLPSTEIDGKLVIEATNPLSTDYKQLMYSNVSSGGNATVYYLDMITSKDSGALPKIVKDPAASNARAIELSPETTMIFRTNYPYNKDRLKKVLCRCRKEAGAPTLHVGVIGIEDKAYKQPDGTYGNNDFYEVTVSGDVTESYVTYVGYIAGTDTVENIESVSRPNKDPDYPAKLLDGTTDIALMIRTGSGTGSIYIDSIELQDTENALTELPKGTMVVNSLEGLTDDNKLSPVEKAYVKTLLAEIDSEHDSVLADGTAAGVDSTLLTALTTKYTALRDIVVPLLENMTKASNITSAFDDAFSEYYSEKTAVQSMTSNLNSAALSLSADTGVILISARGFLITEKIQLTIVSDRIPIVAITIARSDAGALIKVDDYHYILDCSTVLLDDITIDVSATYLGKSYSSTVSVTKYVDPNKTAYSFGGVTIVPSKLPEGAGLVEGDYFLWSDENVATHEDVIPEPGKDALIKGEIYEYNGTKWVKSSNGDLVMTLFDSFADLANDVDSTVIGHAVIKKLVAIDAFIKNLKAQNLSVGVGNGTTGGFRFRAMSDRDMDGSNSPVFDVMYDNKKLFEVVATGTDAGDVIIGDYANGNGIKYDKSAGKFSVKGTIEAGSSVPYSTVSGAPPADADKTSTFIASGTAFQTANGKFKVKTDGSIEAVDGMFTGTVNANEGVFKGSIDSSAFSSLPSSGGTTDNTSLTSSKDYQVNTMCDYCVATLTINHFYSCSVSIDSAVAYIRWRGNSADTDVDFYNSSFVRIAEMRRTYGTFGWSYYSDYAGSALTVSVSYGAGDVFKFKNIPTDSVGLESGQVWSHGGTLKIIP